MMSNFLRSFLVVSVIGILVPVTLSNPNTPKEKPCATVIADLNKQQFGQINECATKLGYTTTEERLQKSACILKCVMQSAGMMSEDGSVSVSKMDEYIQLNFPASLQKKAQIKFLPCVKLVKIASSGVPDEFCKSHDAFVKCISRNLLTFCAQK